MRSRLLAVVGTAVALALSGCGGGGAGTTQGASMESSTVSAPSKPRSATEDGIEEEIQNEIDTVKENPNSAASTKVKKHWGEEAQATRKSLRHTEAEIAKLKEEQGQ
jgi:hypothetical protein